MSARDIRYRLVQALTRESEALSEWRKHHCADGHWSHVAYRTAVRTRLDALDDLTDLAEGGETAIRQLRELKADIARAIRGDVPLADVAHAWDIRPGDIEQPAGVVP